MKPNNLIAKINLLSGFCDQFPGVSDDNLTPEPKCVHAPINGRGHRLRIRA